MDAFDIVVLVVLSLSVVLSLVAWCAGGLAQVALSALLIGGPASCAALIAFAPGGDPGGFAEVYAVGALGVLAVAGGGVLTTSVFRLIDGSGETTEGSMRQAGDVLRGGAWIGGLERTAVFASVVAGWPAGLAIILALKGLGRYAELRSETPGAAERFIIGTFTSVLWAIACAGVALLARA
jgi:hypothetical protein